MSLVENDHGQALNLGRKTRAIPPAMRRALDARDGGCRFPGCTNHRFVDAHHITHWVDGGETALDNLVLLCRRHHRFMHEYGFQITRDSGKLQFASPDGRRVVDAPKVRAVERGSEQLVADHAAAGIAIDDRTLRSWAGDRMDYGWVVGNLCALSPPRDHG